MIEKLDDLLKIQDLLYMQGYRWANGGIQLRSPRYLPLRLNTHKDGDITFNNLSTSVYITEGMRVYSAKEYIEKCTVKRTNVNSKYKFADNCIYVEEGEFKRIQDHLLRIGYTWAWNGRLPSDTATIRTCTDGTLTFCIAPPSLKDIIFSVTNFIEAFPMPTPRPHAELIKQWAEDDSIKIEQKGGGGWIPCNNPLWRPDSKYRIKPVEEKASEATNHEYGEATIEVKVVGDISHIIINGPATIKPNGDVVIG